MHLCLSANPDCSCLCPCTACFDVVITRTLPRAMVATGGPFTDPSWAEGFMQAFFESWRATFQECGPHFKATQPSVVGPRPATETPTLNAQEETIGAQERAELEKAAKQTLPDGTPVHVVEDQPTGQGYDIDEGRMAEYMRLMQREKTTLPAAPEEASPLIEEVAPPEVVQETTVSHQDESGSRVNGSNSNENLNGKDPPQPLPVEGATPDRGGQPDEHVIDG